MRLREILAAGAWLTWVAEPDNVLMHLVEDSAPLDTSEALYELVHELRMYVLIEKTLDEYRVRLYPMLGYEQTYGAGVKLSFRGNVLFNILSRAVRSIRAINTGRLAYGVSGVEHCEPVL